MLTDFLQARVVAHLQGLRFVKLIFFPDRLASKRFLSGLYKKDLENYIILVKHYNFCLVLQAFSVLKRRSRTHRYNIARTIYIRQSFRKLHNILFPCNLTVREITSAVFTVYIGKALMLVCNLICHNNWRIICRSSKKYIDARCHGLNKLRTLDEHIFYIIAAIVKQLRESFFCLTLLLSVV